MNSIDFPIYTFLFHVRPDEPPRQGYMQAEGLPGGMLPIWQSVELLEEYLCGQSPDVYSLAIIETPGDLLALLEAQDPLRVDTVIFDPNSPDEFSMTQSIRLLVEAIRKAN